ncbi:MAG TPA: hemolysin family protein, partial [Thiotrichales bacterium]|nr:hemolysin family protein [Thiotrichales bacterium]
MEILILLALILLNGLFAMTEIALVTSRKARLMKLASEGSRSAEVALKIADDPTKFLSTIQIGITSISILNGIIGEALFAASLSLWFQDLGVPTGTAGVLATTIVVLVVTYVSIVVGELVPKRLGQINPEPIACLVAIPMQWLAYVARPFVALLSGSTHLLMRIMAIKPQAAANVTEEEIQALIAEGSDAGVIEQQQHDMMRNVFRLDDRKLGSLMIPSADVVYLDTNLPPEANLRIVIDSNHSRFPVCEGSLDKVIGVMHARQALAIVARGETPDFRTQLQPAVYVPEMLTGMELLDQFRTNHLQMTFV